MNSSARSPSSAGATTSAKMNGGASTMRCAARAAAAVSAVWLGPVETVTLVKITTNKHTISQNKNSVSAFQLQFGCSCGEAKFSIRLAAYGQLPTLTVRREAAEPADGTAVRGAGAG